VKAAMYWEAKPGWNPGNPGGCRIQSHCLIHLALLLDMGNWIGERRERRDWTEQLIV